MAVSINSDSGTSTNFSNSASHVISSVVAPVGVKALVVSASCEENSTGSMDMDAWTATYGASSMTRIVTSQPVAGTRDAGTVLFWIADPSGTNDITVTPDTNIRSTNVFYHFLDAGADLEVADSQTSAVTNTDTVSVTLSNVGADDIVITAGANPDQTAAHTPTGTDHTEDDDVGDLEFRNFAGHIDPTGSGSHSPGFSLASSELRLSFVAAQFSEVSAGGTILPQMMQMS